MKRPMRERTKYILILICCIVLAAAGMLVSIFVTKDPLDGTRGGILAVGLTLGFVVTKTNLAAKVYLKIHELPRMSANKAENEQTQAGDANEQEIKKLQLEINGLKQQFADFDNLLKEGDEDEKLLNFFLVLATIIGTVVSAIGDVVCRHFIATAVH
jgi:hypothetical protein